VTRSQGSFDTGDVSSGLDSRVENVIGIVGLREFACTIARYDSRTERLTERVNERLRARDFSECADRVTVIFPFEMQVAVGLELAISQCSRAAATINRALRSRRRTLPGLLV